MLRTYGVSLTLALAGLASCLLIRGYIGAIPATIPQPSPSIVEQAEPVVEQTKAGEQSAK